MSKYDVVALGELLVDFTQNGHSEQGNLLFEANPGGAPCNVLAMLRRLDHSCAFIGKVGQDSFGNMLAETAAGAGIDIRALARDSEIPTTLAMVHTLPGGDRDFSFYRKPGADIMLREDELDRELLCNCRIFHFGSLSLTDEPARSATVAALQAARDAGALVSFDPNLRPPLWKSTGLARDQINWGLDCCDILKIADNELLFMTGESDFDRGAASLLKQHPNLHLVNVTAGPDGSYAYYRAADGKILSVFEPACSRGGVIETTGAGDTFCACVLHFVLENGLEKLTEADLHAMLHYANTAAYLVTTRKGAIRSMPTREEIAAIL